MELLRNRWSATRRAGIVGVMLGLSLCAGPARAAIPPDVALSFLDRDPGSFWNMRISGDGRYTAFKYLTAAGSTNNLFIYDRITGTAEQANRMLDGSLPATSRCNVPVISGNGRFVLFGCLSIDMGVPNAGTGAGYFLYDRVSGKSEVVAAAPAAGTYDAT